MTNTEALLAAGIREARIRHWVTTVPRRDDAQWVMWWDDVSALLVLLDDERQKLLAPSGEAALLQLEVNALRNRLLAPSERERALEAALRRIAAMDYRGNEPEEQRIARAALAQPDAQEYEVRVTTGTGVTSGFGTPPSAQPDAQEAK